MSTPRKEIVVHGHSYSIIKSLGKGANGEVFSAKRKSKTYAIKEIPLTQDRIESFQRETQCLKGVKTAFATGLIDFDVTDTCFHLVLDFIEGIALSKYLEDLKKNGLILDEPKIWTFLAQILIGMHAAHNAAIIHRDMKPENVMIDPKKDKLTICDFGEARQINTNQGNAMFMTSFKGSPIFMSPELVTSDQRVQYDARVDVWSLGVTLFQMVYGGFPWRSTNIYQLGEEMKKAHRLRLSHVSVSQELLSVISWCMQKDYTQRPFTAQLLSYPRINALAHTMIDKYVSKDGRAAEHANLPPPDPTMTLRPPPMYSNTTTSFEWETDSGQGRPMDRPQMNTPLPIHPKTKPKPKQVPQQINSQTGQGPQSIISQYGQGNAPSPPSHHPHPAPAQNYPAAAHNQPLEGGTEAIGFLAVPPQDLQAAPHSSPSSPAPSRFPPQQHPPSFPPTPPSFNNSPYSTSENHLPSSSVPPPVVVSHSKSAPNLASVNFMSSPNLPQPRHPHPHPIINISTNNPNYIIPSPSPPQTHPQNLPYHPHPIPKQPTFIQSPQIVSPYSPLVNLSNVQQAITQLQIQPPHQPQFQSPYQNQHHPSPQMQYPQQPQMAYQPSYQNPQFSSPSQPQFGQST
ncbi:putative serine/threonine protein kinase [Blattamonas nauphoetae]|uniref:Serine/threonine protein kinase n=1 Tax=Blattamonas nauphoetae TaxID=2049346 RepID=A0ABQ9WR80_9EUKA|nr:putative serine/threonine protein kinase [Blattamonas nauphoetae]